LADAPAIAAEPDWLVERRREGASSAESLPLPGSKEKGWEFTDLSKLEGTEFEPGSATIGVASGDGVATHLVEAAGDAELGALVEQRLGELTDRADPFVARNEAAWTDGTLIHVPAGEVVSEPIKIDLSAPEGSAAATRTLIVLEEGAEAEVWETWAGGSGGLLNTVTEIHVGQGAHLRYVSLQQLSDDAWVFGTQRAEVGRDASLDWTALGFGSGRGKVRMDTRLAGQGSEARVTGGYAGNGSQHLDYDTTQVHAAPNTISDLAFLGVLADRSTAVWRGMIRVDEGAQGTDAFQECRNLLLSREAHADAIPGLEIEADDVRCTHAAAVAQLDREQLYYLRSRGLAEPAARSLIIEGFLQSLVERLKDGPIRDEVSAALEQRLDEILG
jgi:Fe-S cluster assembly protein SufD